MASTGLARRCRGIFQTQASLVQNGKRNSKVVLFQISEIVSRWVEREIISVMFTFFLSYLELVLVKQYSFNFI